MHIHLLNTLSPLPPLRTPHKPLMLLLLLLLLQFYNKNTFCGAFSASEFSIFAIFMIFLQVGGQGSLAIVRGGIERGWRGVGVGQTTSTCLVYFAVSVALHSHSFPISPSRADGPSRHARAATPPAHPHSRMLHVAGVILILHLAFSFCLCCCWEYKKVDELLRRLPLLMLLSLLPLWQAN